MATARAEWRTLKLTAAAGIAFPHAAQAIQATPAQVAAWIRGHWGIEALHPIRDVTYDDDRSQIRTASGPRIMASLRIL